MKPTKLADIACDIWAAYRAMEPRRVREHSEFGVFGLLVSFDVSCANDGYAKDGNTALFNEIAVRKDIKLLFCGSRIVFLSHQVVNEPEVWKSIASHDSGWRDINSDVSSIIDDMEDEIKAKIPAEHVEDTGEVSWHSWAGIDNLFNPCWVDYKSGNGMPVLNKITRIYPAYD